jgi:hypothetical protein
MDYPNPRLQDVSAPLDNVRTSKARRLGTALHQLARDLARERRRTAQLERELANLRAEQPLADAPVRVNTDHHNGGPMP